MLRNQLTINLPSLFWRIKRKAVWKDCQNFATRIINPSLFFCTVLSDIVCLFPDLRSAVKWLGRVTANGAAITRCWVPPRAGLGVWDKCSLRIDQTPLPGPAGETGPSLARPPEAAFTTTSQLRGCCDSCQAATATNSCYAPAAAAVITPVTQPYSGQSWHSEIWDKWQLTTQFACLDSAPDMWESDVKCALGPWQSLISAPSLV